MKKSLKVVALSLVAMMALSGCGGTNTASNFELGEPVYGDTYPIETDKTVSWWLSASLNAMYMDPDDQPIYKGYQDQTGVDIEFILPAVGQSSEAFRLMVASGEFPDLITSNWATHDGGPQAYVKEGVIIPVMHEAITKYAPNLMKVMEENPQIEELVTDNNGEFYMFPAFNSPDYDGKTVGGPIVRMDLFEKYNIAIPHTQDEWYEALKALKANGVRYPIVVADASTPFRGLTNAQYDFYQEDGVVKLGIMEREWLDYVNLFQKWFAEGLIDADIGNVDTATYDQKILSGQSAVFEQQGTGFNRISSAGKKANPEFRIHGIKQPIPKEGERTTASSVVGRKWSGYGSTIITTDCKDIELAARVADYAFSPAGRILTNFGIEGESFEYVDGVPTFTDAVRDPKTGNITGIDRYTMVPAGIPAQNMISEWGSYLQRAGDPDFLDSIEDWSDHDVYDYVLPMLIMTPEQSESVKGVSLQAFNEAQTFFLNGVTGGKQITEEEWQKYVDTLKSYGIEKEIKIRQELYDQKFKK